MNILTTSLVSLRKLDIRLIGMMLVLAAMIVPELAFASSGNADADLPFVGVMEKLQKQLTGPFAFSLSIIGIVAAGAMLIFGGDMNGFMRTLIFLVLVIAVIVGAGNIMTFISSNAAVVASADALVNAAAARHTA